MNLKYLKTFETFISYPAVGELNDKQQIKTVNIDTGLEDEEDYEVKVKELPKEKNKDVKKKKKLKRVSKN